MFNSKSQNHWELLGTFTDSFRERDPKQTKAYNQLMETDYYDVSLEDKIHAVMEERGIELFEDNYEDEFSKLQEEYLASWLEDFSEEVMFSEVPDWVNFAGGPGTGTPCGDSHISSSKTCRIGSGPDFSRASDTEKEKLESEYANFQGVISGYSPESREAWEKLVRDTVDRNKPENTRYNRTDEQATASYHKIVKAATILAEDGPPTKITDKAGNEITMHDKFQPYVSEGGRMMWRDPYANNVFTKRSAGQMELTTMKEQLADDLRNGRVEASLKHYKKYKSSKTAQAKGAFGSPEAAKLRTVDDAEIDSFMKGLNKQQLNAFAKSGLDVFPGKMGTSGFDQRAQHSKFFFDNPDEMDRRTRETVRSYLQQTPGPGKKAISPFTGLELDIPGTRGPGAAVIDHYQPISKFYPSRASTAVRNGAWTTDQGRLAARQADTSQNMVFVERGLNQSKSAKEDWNKITRDWGKAQSTYDQRVERGKKLPSFTTGAPGSSVQVRQRRTYTSNRQAPTQPRSSRSTGLSKTEKEAKAASTREAKRERLAKANQKKLDSLEKKAAAARKKRDGYKPGGSLYKRAAEKVNQAAQEARQFKIDNNL